MRNTLRLLGIIALAALIGFGLIACNDGSTTTDDTVNNKTPIEGDYDIVVGEHIWDGEAKIAKIEPKSGKSQGAVHVYYDGKTDKIPPKDIGDYEVTFDVMPVPGWNKAEGLKAGTLSIVSASSVRFHPVVDDFIIEGTGIYPLDGSIRRVTVTAKEGKTKGPITIFYNGDTALPSSKDAANYDVTFNVGASGDYYAATGLVAGNLTIMAALVPELGDFDISGRSQIYDPDNMTKRPLKVVPKAGKSEGRITQKFTGIEGTAYPANLTAPWTVGTYNVEITIEQWENFEKKTFDAGVMEIRTQRSTNNGANPLGNPDISYFDIVGSVVGGDWDGTWTFPEYDGTRKVVSVNAIEDKTQGVIDVTYWALDMYGRRDPNGLVQEYLEVYEGSGIKDWMPVAPKNAGGYQVMINVAESYGFIAKEIEGPVITIPKRIPKPSDFEVWLGDATGTPWLFGVGQGSWRDIDENNEIGPYTYKNKGYSVGLRSKVDKTMLEGVSWAKVTYNDNTIVQNGKDIGPKDAGTYAVKLTLDPSDNYQTYAGFKVGTLVILKKTPAALDYELTNYGGVYKLKGGDGNDKDDPIKGGGPMTVSGSPRESLISVQRFNSDDPDNIVASRGKVVLKLAGVEIAKTVVTGGQYNENTPVTHANKDNFPVNAGSYPITLEVEEDTKSGNWEAATLNLGNFVINRAVVKLEDFDFDKYHAQTAYTVEEPVVQALKNRTDGQLTLKYFKYDPSNPGRTPYTKSNEGRWTEKLPQTEGYYRVLLYVGQGANYLAADNFPATDGDADGVNGKYHAFKAIWTYLAGEDTEYIQYGLVVNPVYITSVADYKQWLTAVKRNLNTNPPKLEINEFDVNFEIPDEKALTAAQAAELKTLLQDDAVKIHANFAGTEVLTPGDKYEDDPFGTDPVSVTTDGTAEGAVTFGASSFEDCVSLLKVSFVPGVDTLGEGAFRGCSNLKEIDISRAVDLKIGEEAFKGTKIEKLVLSNTLATIGKSAFEGVETLKAVSMPAEGEDAPTLTDIFRAAFKGCINLGAVAIPDSVARIDVEAFAGCTSLTAVEFFSDEIESIGEGLEAGEEDLELETFPGDLLGKFADTSLGGIGMYKRTLGYDAWTNQDKPYGLGSD